MDGDIGEVCWSRLYRVVAWDYLIIGGQAATARRRAECMHIIFCALYLLVLGFKISDVEL